MVIVKEREFQLPLRRVLIVVGRVLIVVDQKRIERGLSKGLSRSESRGHGKPKGVMGVEKATSFVYDPRLELGVKAMRKGDSLTKAAKDLNVAPQTSARHHEHA